MMDKTNLCSLGSLFKGGDSIDSNEYQLVRVNESSEIALVVRSILNWAMY